MVIKYYNDGDYLDGDCYGNRPNESFNDLLVGRVWLEIVRDDIYTERFVSVSSATYQRLLTMGKIY